MEFIISLRVIVKVTINPPPPLPFQRGATSPDPAGRAACIAYADPPPQPGSLVCLYPGGQEAKSFRGAGPSGVRQEGTVNKHQCLSIQKYLHVHLSSEVMRDGAIQFI